MHSNTICYKSGGSTPLEITSPQIEPYTDKTRQEECSGLFWLSYGQDIFVFEWPKPFERNLRDVLCWGENIDE